MNFEERYGTLDRFLYRTAFRAGTAQHALADVEEILYRDALKEISSDDPVFISALPRSGTTILLRLLFETGHFASHTYQDMPFLLCPLLWDQFSESMGRDEVTRERAHADGLDVSGTSPEAFEELIWKHFWDDHYRPDHIRVWTDADRHSEFETFFESHMRKVIALRGNGDPPTMRYLSKNNLNIARLAAPPSPLQNGTFVIPFREPVQHAASMLRQHRRFLDLHEEDDFVREYMEAIGHHEFGKGLRPVNFGNWLDDAPDSETLSFWVRYWIAAYEFVLDHAGSSTVLMSYDTLTTDPAPSLAALADALKMDPSTLTQFEDRLRPPRSHDIEDDSVSEALVDRATELYERLIQTAIQ